MTVGVTVRSATGDFEGKIDGSSAGDIEDILDGATLGSQLGESVGIALGWADGMVVVGLSEGTNVGV